MAEPEGEVDSVLSAAREAHDLGTLEGLRERSVGRMQDFDLPAPTRLRWALVALAICQAKEELGGIAPLAIIADTARVRAYAILQFGPMNGDRLRDPVQLFEEVVATIGESPEDVARRASGWQGLPREEILHLRRIKNVLSAVALVKDEPALQSAPTRDDVRSWLDVMPLLP